jgi:hypothetical protein
MNYTPEQISQIVLKVLKEVNTFDISSLSLKEKRTQAGDPNTPPETLDRLAGDKDWLVRDAVARNPNTSIETLAFLAADEVSNVRNWVARNPKTSPETLDCLANDVVWHIRYNVARNPKTSPETLDRLANDDCWEVRSIVEQHPNYNPPTTTLTITKQQKEALLKLIESSQDESLKTIQLQ